MEQLSTKPKTAWSAPQRPLESQSEGTSLADVMSEQLAHHLSKPDSGDQSNKEIVVPQPEAADIGFSTSDEMNDAIIAQMLQYEFDLEHDEMLRVKERHVNGASKISISYKHQRQLHPYEVGDELQEVYDFPEPEVVENKPPEFNSRGYIRKGNEIITKHDAEICGRRNADRVMDFPLGFNTGDDAEYDQKLPNRVFNELKVHSAALENRRKRTKDKKEEVSTATLAVDPKTRILLYKLVNGGTLSDINGLVATGKEAAVFHATGGVDPASNEPLPEECAVKVFKTTLNEFRNRDPYIRDDYRFQERFSKLNPRKIVKFWAEKEYLNLKRMTEFGLPCPKPILLRKHILLMEFVGRDQKPAQQLKDASLSADQLKKAYKDVCDIMRRMFKDCKLIHADFSEYNLLYHDEKVWVIDVSQAVEPSHPHALEFLYRDCSNVFNFFARRGLDKMLTIKELFKDITGISIEGTEKEIPGELARHGPQKQKPHLFSPDADTSSFDYLYALAMQQRELEASAAGDDDEEEEDWEDEE